MDSRMIDVAIGLVLVFALASLAVSTLHEIWVSMRRSRGSNLDVALRGLLHDDRSGFADALLQHPLLQALADPGKGDKAKPSYMASDVFVTALVARLSELYTGNRRPDTPEALLSAMEQGGGRVTAGPSGPLKHAMLALSHGTEQDWTRYQQRLQLWYDAAADRSGGWFRRDTQLRLFVVGFLLAAVVNINPLVIAPRLWSDKALREATVAAAVRVSQAASEAGSGDANALIERLGAALKPATAKAAPVSTGALQAETDLAQKAMERAYRAAVAEVGRLPDAARRGPAFEWLQLLAQADRDLQQLVQQRRGWQLDGKQAEVDKAGDIVSRRLDGLSTLLAGEPDGGSLAERLKPVLGDLRTALLDEIRPPAAPDALDNSHCPKNGDAVATRLCQRMHAMREANQELGLPLGWQLSSLPACSDRPCASIKTGLQDANVWMLSLAGWALTGLATMLGAPFWFDALGRLIKLRAAGVKPEEGEAGGAKGADTKASLTADAPAPTSAGGGAAAEPMHDAQTAAERRLSPARLKELQARLQMPVELQNGVFGDKTRDAIAAWQRGRGLAETGELSEEQLDELLRGPAPGAAAAHEHHDDEDCGCGAHDAQPDADLPEAR